MARSLGCGLFNDTFCTAEATRYVRVHSIKYGIFVWALRLGIVIFIMVAFFIKQSHLKYEEGLSTVRTRVRGSLYTQFPGFPYLDGFVWDPADVVIPAQENNAKFILTNVIVTPNQTQGICEEAPDVFDAQCDNTTCQPGRAPPRGHGVMTGICLNSTRRPGQKVCEIHAWCPVPDNQHKTAKPALEDSKNFILIIKNDIFFPEANKRRDNYPIHATSDYLRTCRYNPHDPRDKLCPSFELGTIVELAGYDYRSVAEEGGSFEIIITWDCDLSWYDISDCDPTYSFHRVDMNNSREYGTSGYHFRYADHYMVNGVPTRTYYGATGLRLIFSVNSKAGRCDFVTLVTNIGSYIGLFSAAAFVVALVMVCRRSDVKEKLYHDIDTEHSFKEVCCESVTIPCPRLPESDVTEDQPLITQV